MRLGSHSPRALAASRVAEALPVLAIAAWGVAVLRPQLPGASLARLGMSGAAGLLFVPALTFLIAALRPGDRGWRFAAVGAAMVLGVLYGVPIVDAQPTIAYALPLLAVGALIGARFPVTALVLATAIVGFQGTITAYTPIRVRVFYDALLLCFVLGVLLHTLRGRRSHSVRVMPAVALLGAYVALTAFAIFVAPSIVGGFQAFRASQWFMLVALVVALAAFDGAVRWRLMRGLLVVHLAVAAYATLRYAIGPSAKEHALAARSHGAYTQVAGELRLFGSFIAASTLMSWSVVSAAFALPLALALRGRWRLIAAATTALSGFVVLVGGVRTGVVAIIPAMMIVMVLYLGARAFPGPRMLIAGVLVLVLAAGGAVAMSTTVLRNDGLKDRFESLLNPTNDESYQARLIKWRAAMEDVERYPLGQGLGTGGSTSLRYARFVTPGQTSIDSSYLKIMVEQGPAVLLLFVFAMVALAITFAAAAHRARDALDAALYVGGAASIAGLLVMYYAGTFVEESSSLQAFLLLGVAMAALALPARAPAPATPRPRARHRPSPAPSGAVPSAA